MSRMATRKWQAVLMALIGGVARAGEIAKAAEAAEPEPEPEPEPESAPRPVTYDFQRLIGRLRDELVHFVAKLARGDKATAEDVVQTAMIRAFRAWEKWSPSVGYDGTVDEQASARAWVYRICSNTYYNECNTRKRRGEILERVLDDVRAEEERAQAVRDVPLIEEDEAVGLSDKVIEALETLRPHWRKMLLLHAQGVGHRDIANELGVTFGSVSSGISRAKAQIAELLTRTSLPYEATRKEREKLATRRLGEETPLIRLP